LKEVVTKYILTHVATSQIKATITTVTLRIKTIEKVVVQVAPIIILVAIAIITIIIITTTKIEISKTNKPYPTFR
jgi:hypothetical protein